MIDSITRITLNLQETNTMVSIKAKRGDTGRKLLIHLSDGSIPYHISDECYATFTAKKPDGNKINNPCSIENNVIIYEFTEQTCTAVGTMKAEIRLYGADDKMITSACFLINVHDTVFRDGDEVGSETEMNTLDDLILRGNEFLNETGKILRWEGNWDSEAEYEANDLVLHEEVLYVAEAAIAAGTVPGSEESAWVPIAGMIDLTGYATENWVKEQKYLESSALSSAVNDALAQAKKSGEFSGEDGYTPIKGVDYFDGEPGYTPQKGIDYFDGKDGQDGKDYVLTDDDRAEIAKQAADLVEVPDSSAFYITFSGKAGNYTADKTYDETKEAYEAGRPVYAIVTATIDNFGVNGAIIPISSVFDSFISFESIEYTRAVYASISKYGVTLSQTPLSERAGVPTDDEIIALINKHAPDSAGAFIVTITESGDKYTADKIPSEIYAAHNSGVPVLASLMAEGGIVTAYLVTATEDAAMFQVPNFMLGEEQMGVTVTIAGNDPADRSVSIVENTIPDSGWNVELDTTLKEEGKAADAKAVGDALNGKLSSSELPTAINTALAQAKASGEFDGQPGTSVTVKSVSESTADGGSNVVTFSDGKTLTVKNGKTGADGKDGADGNDYVLTPADKEEIAELAAGLVEAPEGSGGGIAVTGATVGQTVKISAVDENGVPTAWEPVDFPNGGGGSGDSVETIWEITISEEAVLTVEHTFTDEEVEKINTARMVNFSFCTPDKYETGIQGVTFGVYRTSWYGYVHKFKNNVALSLQHNTRHVSSYKFIDNFKSGLYERVDTEMFPGISANVKSTAHYGNILNNGNTDSLKAITTTEDGFPVGTVIKVEVIA